MKKWIICILLIFITGSSLFYYGYFDVMLFCSKEKASQSIAAARYNHTLTLFKVSANKQEQYSDDEVRINGQLYDVGEREIINDTLYLSLYHDTDEESVLSVINNFFNPDDNNLVSIPANAPLLKCIRIIPNPQYTFDISRARLHADAVAKVYVTGNSSLTSLIFYDIITPPPRLS